MGPSEMAKKMTKAHTATTVTRSAAVMEPPAESNDEAAITDRLTAMPASPTYRSGLRPTRSIMAMAPTVASTLITPTLTVAQMAADPAANPASWKMRGA